ncbi:MAG: hypothetical protein PHU34_00330 [Candidatus Methanoperedens sp.]|nr:hypothetical protein [Candidatus Methanoperedens sp.]
MRKIRFAVLVIAIVFFAQLLFFYRGIYFPPPVMTPDFLSVNVNMSVPFGTNDNFTAGSGTVLIDMSHKNNFNTGELNLLFSRIIARGYRIEYFKDSSNLTKNLSSSTSFVVISPASSFSTADAMSVKSFVVGGGRLLMLSDPIKESDINSLAAEFGILFWNDYLYNLKENEGNFRYIYLTDFPENTITKGLRRIVFYTSGSVFGNGIIFTDNDTYSSSSGEKGRYSVAVMAEDSRVLAIGDVTFLSEPYNVMDNNRLVYNIADFLAPPAAQAIPAEIIPVNISNVSRVANATTNISANKTVSNETAHGK